MIVPSDTDYSLQNPPMFSSEGRIGRLRWLAYVTAAATLMAIIFAALRFMVPVAIYGMLSLALTGAFIWYFVLITIQRSHDFDRTGWISIAAVACFFLPTLLALSSLVLGVAVRTYVLLPALALSWLLPFFWALMPGTKGPNAYGRPTIKNSIGVYVLCGFFVLSLLGMVVAAVSFGHSYMKFAQEIQNRSDKRAVPRDRSTDREPIRRAPQEKRIGI